MACLVIAPSHDYGGGEMFVETLDLALSGEKVHFLVNNDRLASRIIAGRYVKKINAKNQIVAIASLLFFSWKLHLKHNYRFIVLNGLPEIGVFARFFPRTNLICVGHSEEAWATKPVSFKRPLHWLKRLVGANFSEFLHTFICISKKTEDNVCARFKLAEKCFLLYPTIKPFPIGSRNRVESNAEKIVFGRLGRLTEGKGNEDLIMAFSMARKRGYKIELIFAGEGEDREKLKQLAESLGVAEFVLFTGFMAREEFFPLVDVCVSPSYHEGFPLVLLEAMYAKKSIVATKVGGVREMLNHECALLIDAGDVYELLESIALLYHSKQKRTKMTELAYSRYSTHFSPEVFTQKVLELFNDR